jgi:signal transduction histidine kinase
MKKVVACFLCMIFSVLFLVPASVKDRAFDSGQELSSSDLQEQETYAQDTTMGMQKSLSKKNRPMPRATTKLEAKTSAELPRDDQFIDAEEEKKKQVIALVHKGVAALRDMDIAQACELITHSPDFRYGDLYVFVFDADGMVLAHEDVHQIWRNKYNYKDEFDTYAFRPIIDRAIGTSGWSVYYFKRAIKNVYSQAIEKNKKKYIVCCGYYPLNKAGYVVGMVKTAVNLFDRLLEKGYTLDVVWGALGYQLGKFVYGFNYIYVLNQQGILLAHGRNPGLAGESVINNQDAKGFYINQEIIKQLKNKSPGDGIWVDYISKNALKKAYGERVVDKKGNSYFIVSGFHPEENPQAAVDLVRKGVFFFNTYGEKEGTQKISHADFLKEFALQSFIYGDLYLIIYNMQGICIADAVNEDLVGRDQSALRDEDGRFEVKEIIEKAKREGSGWISFKMYNAFLNVYLEKVHVGSQDYVICCGLYPVTEKDTMVLLVKSAAEYLKSHEDRTAFYEFGKDSSRFIYGALNIFALDTRGVCYAWGADKDLIWQNLYTRIDQDGQQYVKRMIRDIRQGPVFLRTKELHAPKLYYGEPVIKGNKTYIVGSGFFS